MKSPGGQVRGTGYAVEGARTGRLDLKKGRGHQPSDLFRLPSMTRARPRGPNRARNSGEGAAAHEMRHLSGQRSEGLTLGASARDGDRGSQRERHPNDPEGVCTFAGKTLPPRVGGRGSHGDEDLSGSSAMLVDTGMVDAGVQTGSNPVSAMRVMGPAPLAEPRRSAEDYVPDPTQRLSADMAMTGAWYASAKRCVSSWCLEYITAVSSLCVPLERCSLCAEQKGDHCSRGVSRAEAEPMRSPRSTV
jgi:hypothetical protein